MKSLFGYLVYEHEVRGMGPIVFGDFSEYMTPIIWENVKAGDRLHIKYDGKEMDVIVDVIDADGTIHLKT